MSFENGSKIMKNKLDTAGKYSEPLRIFETHF